MSKEVILQAATKSEAETIAIGKEFGRHLPSGSVVCFHGDLAGGKTTFIKGLAAGAAGIHPDMVNSPTFVYLNIYEGAPTIYHFDLYRLKDEEEFLSMGFDELFFAGGICCVEWSERIPGLIPEMHFLVEMKHISASARQVAITKFQGSK